MRATAAMLILCAPDVVIYPIIAIICATKRQHTRGVMQSLPIADDGAIKAEISALVVMPAGRKDWR